MLSFKRYHLSFFSVANLGYIFHLNLFLYIYFLKQCSTQLLVNRTLYEKTLASGFGAVHFIIDASEQQQVINSVLLAFISFLNSFIPQSYLVY